MSKPVLLLFLCVAAVTTSRAAVWQFAVDTGVKEHGKAFLWIPPECAHVRGLIVGGEDFFACQFGRLGCGFQPQ